MSVPREPMMLMSYINMQLRDNFDSLDALCEDFDVDKQEIFEILGTIGYKYDAKTNQFGK